MNDSYHIEELEIRISNYLSGNCTEEEKEALFAYLASNEDAAKIFREMSAVWAVSSVPAFAKVEDANLSQIKEKIAAAEMKPVRSRKIVPVLQSPNQKIPDRKTKCVIKTHINIKQNVIFGAKLKPV